MTAITAEADASVQAAAAAPPLAEVVEDVVEEVVAPTLLRNPKLVLMAADLAMVAVSVVAAYELERGSVFQLGLNAGAGRFLALALVTIPVWLGIFTHQRLYNTRFIGRRIDENRRVINAVFMSVVAIALTGYCIGFLVPRTALIALFLIAVVLVSLEREVARRTFAYLRHRGHLVRHVVIAGANPEARELAAMLQNEPWLGYRVLGFVDDAPEDHEVRLLGGIGDAADIVARHRGASVIVAASAVESETTNRLARDLIDRGIHVELSSTLRDIASHRLTVRPLGRFPIVYVEPVQREGWRRIAKRTFDITGALLGLLFFAPVLAVAAIAIKATSPGPVVFRQTRVGRDNRRFEVLKLRTMIDGAERLLPDLLHQNEADGPLFKMREDPRITSVGRILRKTSLDEVPQLWNVLRGEMSLVGPRPALPQETEHWDPLLAQRLRVKPGITGMWQVNGRSEASFEDYTRLDLYYVDNWSLTTDLSILAKTVPVVLARQGAA
jgi:exopolysaccharide biosynthesis polyprenyl glycosylphosphotransferase